MGAFSKVVLLGHLTRDPSTGTLSSGASVCEFGWGGQPVLERR